jgi:hypothetical protein
VYALDGLGLGRGLLPATKFAVRERELVVRLRVAGRERGGAAEVLDRLGGAAPCDERAAQGHARLVEVGVYPDGAGERPDALLRLRAAALD